MSFVVCCLLLVVRCVLLVGCCFLYAVCGLYFVVSLLLVVCCGVLLFVVCWCDCCGCPLLLFVVGCLRSLLIVVVCDSLWLCVVVCGLLCVVAFCLFLWCVVRCPLLVVRWLFVVRCLSFDVVCCSLFVDVCLVCLV